MRVLCYKRVVDYLVAFDLAEVIKLRDMGQLPPSCTIPTYLWMTVTELAATLRDLGQLPPNCTIPTYLWMTVTELAATLDLLGYPFEQLRIKGLPEVHEYAVRNQK